MLKGGYFFFFVLKVGKKGNLRNEKDLGKKKMNRRFGSRLANLKLTFGVN